MSSLGPGLHIPEHTPGIEALPVVIASFSFFQKNALLVAVILGMHFALPLDHQQSRVDQQVLEIPHLDI